MAQFPNPYNAQGVWSLRSQLVARMGNNWPGVVTVTEIFTSSTTWTCPTGVTAVDYLVVAGLEWLEMAWNGLEWLGMAWNGSVS